MQVVLDPAASEMEPLARSFGQAALTLQSSKRDVAVEDEIFHCGYFADVVFKFRNASVEVEEVYGQSALFALLCPTLRETLMPASQALPGDAAQQQSGFCSAAECASGAPSAATAAMPYHPSGSAARACSQVSRREVWPDPEITARAFREVARYVYRLAPQVSSAVLPEALYAARSFGMEELEEMLLAWGFADLGSLNPPLAADSMAAERIIEGDNDAALDNALLTLECMCMLMPRPSCTTAWREALLRNFSARQVLGSPIFFKFQPEALQELLGAEPMHADPMELWRACVEWALVRGGHYNLVLPKEPPLGAPAGCGRVPPKKLFGQSARLSQALAPTAPANEAVEWQEPLLLVVQQLRFWQLSAADFAALLEGIAPVLPQLREAIYSSRRKGVRTGEQAL